MTITPAEYEILQARQAHKETCPIREGFYGGTLSVWIAGKPWNPQGSDLHTARYKKAKVIKEWRERTAHRLFAYVQWNTRKREWAPKVPKVVTFAIYSRNPFDSDNRAAVCKPLRDALKDARLIDDDRDSSGHSFSYGQVIARQRGAMHGIAIDIRLRDA